MAWAVPEVLAMLVVVDELVEPDPLLAVVAVVEPVPATVDVWLVLVAGVVLLPQPAIANVPTSDAVTRAPVVSRRRRRRSMRTPEAGSR